MKKELFVSMAILSLQSCSNSEDKKDIRVNVEPKAAVKKKVKKKKT